MPPSVTLISSYTGRVGPDILPLQLTISDAACIAGFNFSWGKAGFLGI